MPSGGLALELTDFVNAFQLTAIDTCSITTSDIVDESDQGDSRKTPEFCGRLYDGNMATNLRYGMYWLLLLYFETM